MSDLHYEILAPDVVEKLPRPEADILVLAGDYDHARRAVVRARRQFPEIPLIMIAGNHEHYRNAKSVRDDLETMREYSRLDREVACLDTHFLENETVELELAGQKLRFIGATLWTDFDLFKNQPGHMRYAQIAMNDYALILGDRGDGHSLAAAETLDWFRKSRQFIEAELRKTFAGKTVVVTHHLPSLRSVAMRYRTDALTPAFASDCDDLLALGAGLWIHGHTHDSADYVAGTTRVVCNPRGYPSRYGGPADGENKFFRPDLVVEI